MKTKEIDILIDSLRFPEAYDEARRALVEEAGAPAIPLLIEALNDEDLSLAVVEVLKEIGAPAVKPLVAALADRKVSAYAAIVLEDIGSPSVALLIKALANKRRRVRVLAVRALGNIGDERAVKPVSRFLIELFVPAGVESLQDAAIESLRKLWKIPEKKEAITTEEFLKELVKRGFEVSPRSDRLYYNPQIPDLRFAVKKKVIRIEKRFQADRGRRWQLARSFLMTRELQMALIVAGAMLESNRCNDPG